jgi:hypothetical protein
LPHDPFPSLFSAGYCFNSSFKKKGIRDEMTNEVQHLLFGSGPHAKINGKPVIGGINMGTESENRSFSKEGK